MNTEIFDLDYLVETIDMSPENVAHTIPDNKTFGRKFSSRPRYLQRMGLRDDGCMGHYNMSDVSYQFDKTPKSTREICAWAQNKLLILAQTPDFELVVHGGIISPTIQQVANILARKQEGLLDHYIESDEYAGFWQLDNNYFFSTTPGNGIKFYEYLLKD